MNEAAKGMQELTSSSATGHMVETIQVPKERYEETGR
jgi:hypothetical protein